MRPFVISLVLIIVGFVAAPASWAGCTGCQGDVGVKLTQKQFWGGNGQSQYAKHVHAFSALCDAADLPNFFGEVYISIVVVADLVGATKYVTANFISGTRVTPITSVNGFINAPTDGRFFADKSGKTACAGEENIAVVQLDYNDFNALLANGDGTMSIEILASNDVKDVCNVCCESGHAWTPASCCTASPPCACPKGVGSYTQASLVYLDCDVWSIIFQCTSDAKCDDGAFCTGQEYCDNGACVSPGSPCSGTGMVCDEYFKNPDGTFGACVNCDTIGQTAGDHDNACEGEDAIFCNGLSTCVQVGSQYVCQQQPNTEPCPPVSCYENLYQCLVCSP